MPIGAVRQTFIAKIQKVPMTPANKAKETKTFNVVTTKNGYTITLPASYNLVPGKNKIPLGTTIIDKQGVQIPVQPTGYLICEHQGGGFWDCQYVW